MEGATLLQVVRIYLSPDAILFLMIFLHIIDDFCLQGIMASMKQKSWWQEHPVREVDGRSHAHSAVILDSSKPNGAGIMPAPIWYLSFCDY